MGLTLNKPPKGTPDYHILLNENFEKIEGSVNGIEEKIGSTAEIDVATIDSDGLMSKDDKEKLDGIAANAEVNQNAFSNVGKIKQ